MEKEYPEAAKNAVEALAKKLNDRPAMLGGKNPHTIKPPPPTPKYDTTVQAAVKRRFRLTGKSDLQAVAVKDVYGKVFITGKKGKMVKISSITKPK